MGKVKVTKDLVHKIAGLAMVPLTVHEEELHTPQLSLILDYVDQLFSVDTSSVGPSFNVTNLKNVMREDETSAKHTLTQDEALANAPEKEKGLLKTKALK